MKHVSIPGLILAGFYVAVAIAAIVADRTAPLQFSSGFLSGAVVLPALWVVVFLRIKTTVYSDAFMACAILFCAALFYLLGWLAAKVIRFLRTLL